MHLYKLKKYQAPNFICPWLANWIVTCEKALDGALRKHAATRWPGLHTKCCEKKYHWENHLDIVSVLNALSSLLCVVYESCNTVICCLLRWDRIWIT